MEQTLGPCFAASGDQLSTGGAIFGHLWIVQLDGQRTATDPQSLNELHTITPIPASADGH